MGDPAGIGPEICAKAFASPALAKFARCVVIGDQRWLPKRLKVIDLHNAGVSEKVITFMENTPNTMMVAQAPPPPPTEPMVVAPSPEYVWMDGEWAWNGATYVWIGGRWVLPPHHHAIWVSAHWVHGPHGYYRVGGHWR